MLGKCLGRVVEKAAAILSVLPAKRLNVGGRSDGRESQADARVSAGPAHAEATGRAGCSLRSRRRWEVFGRNVARAESEADGGEQGRSRERNVARQRASDGKPTVREALNT